MSKCIGQKIRTKLHMGYGNIHLLKFPLMHHDGWHRNVNKDFDRITNVPHGSLKMRVELGDVIYIIKKALVRNAVYEWAEMQ